MDELTEAAFRAALLLALDNGATIADLLGEIEHQNVCDIQSFTYVDGYTEYLVKPRAGR